MESDRLRLGLMGWGEVARIFAKALAENGLTGIVAYSRSAAAAAPGDPLRESAEAAGVTLAATPADLCERAELIIAVTPGAAALSAVRSVRRHLTQRHIYVDASASSVKSMERAAKLLDGKAGFVDAAIMNSVPLDGIKVPIVASGARANRLRELMTPYGMNIQVVGDRPGAASAMKLIRSVCLKGLGVLLIEALEAAQRHGILEATFADIAGSMDERPFAHIAKRLVCGTAVHAERRVHEMTESLTLLRSLGASIRMTRATRAMLEDVAAMGLRERFGGREPDSIAPVIEAIVQARG